MSPNIRIYVTNHALERFEQRFKYKFHSSYFYSKELKLNLIKELIKHSYEESLTKCCPFYANKLKTVHKRTTILYQLDKQIYFAVIIINSEIKVKSCFNSFNPRGKITGIL